MVPQCYMLCLYVYGLQPIVLPCFVLLCNIGIKHGFSCINICQVPREMLKTEAIRRVFFQHLPRDLANDNVLENNV